MAKKVDIYCTTLRDGGQDGRISMSVPDKLKIVKEIDKVGIPFIEGGWPDANPTDLAFFQRVAKLDLRAEVVAFGRTCKPNTDPAKDSNIRKLLQANTNVVTIFGKTWDLHVTDVLKTTLEENRRIIRESVAYLVSQGKVVFFDAEHFFDGYKANSDYALQLLEDAQEGGASIIIPCDTNGGAFPGEVRKALKEVKRFLKVPFAFHGHNDSGLAVACSLEAVMVGATQIQGTINGYGERCGNTDLVVVIGDLLKMGIQCLDPENLPVIRHLSREIAQILNVRRDHSQPFVGENAFRHKGGTHQLAVRRNPVTSEHVPPETMGNKRHFPVSDQAGGISVVECLKEMFPDLKRKDTFVQDVLEEVKQRAHKGYIFDAADASVQLIGRRLIKGYRPPFKIRSRRVVLMGGKEDGKKSYSLQHIIMDKMPHKSEAIVKLEVRGVKRLQHKVAEGNGPVNALDNAFREALEPFFPELKKVHLTDYKVRVLAGEDGTAAKVSVLIESNNNSREWNTVGVSEDIIEASKIALLESYEYAIWLKELNNKE